MKQAAGKQSLSKGVWLDSGYMGAPRGIAHFCSLWWMLFGRLRVVMQTLRGLHGYGKVSHSCTGRKVELLLGAQEKEMHCVNPSLLQNKCHHCSDTGRSSGRSPGRLVSGNDPKLQACGKTKVPARRLCKLRFTH